MFLKKLLFIVLVTYAASVAIGNYFDSKYIKRWSILFFDKTNALINDSTSYNGIHLGNSRVHFGINPYYVDSVTGLKSYNFGMGGGNAQEIMFTGNIYLAKKRPPKYVAISLDRSAFVETPVLKTRFHYFFYLDNDTIYKHLKQTFPAAPVVKFFPFLKYSFFDEYNRTSLFSSGRPYPVFAHNITRGFLNIHQNQNTTDNVFFNTAPADSAIFSEKSKGYIRNIITNFVRAGTKVFLLMPPAKPFSPGNTPMQQIFLDSMISNVAAGIPIKKFDFTNSPLLTNEYFTDDIHLNEPGARIYSILIADSIKTYLEK